METQMILVTRMCVLIQKLNEKKSHQGLLSTVLSQVPKKALDPNWKKMQRMKTFTTPYGFVCFTNP